MYEYILRLGKQVFTKFVGGGQRPAGESPHHCNSPNTQRWVCLQQRQIHQQNLYSLSLSYLSLGKRKSNVIV